MIPAAAVETGTSLKIVECCKHSSRTRQSNKVDNCLKADSLHAVASVLLHLCALATGTNTGVYYRSPHMILPNGAHKALALCKPLLPSLSTWGCHTDKHNCYTDSKYCSILFTAYSNCRQQCCLVSRSLAHKSHANHRPGGAQDQGHQPDADAVSCQSLPWWHESRVTSANAASWAT